MKILYQIQEAFIRLIPVRFRYSLLERSMRSLDEGPPLLLEQRELPDKSTPVSIPSPRIVFVDAAKVQDRALRNMELN